MTDQIDFIDTALTDFGDILHDELFCEGDHCMGITFYDDRMSFDIPPDVVMVIDDVDETFGEIEDFINHDTFGEPEAVKYEGPVGTDFDV